MAEDRLYEPCPSDEEEIGAEKSLRPIRLEEFVGQRRVVENLRIAIGAAGARGEVLDHVLLSGLPGLGKTTLAFLIASTIEVDIRCASGPSLQKGRDIVGLLTGLSRGDVLFIDEVHRISKETEEYLYSAMEDFKVDLLVDRGPDARSYRISVEPFTLVGATTREGLLSAPFRSRFGIVEKLEVYPEEDLLEIVKRSADILGCQISDGAGRLLASRSRGTPRYANRFLRRIRDLAQVRAGRIGRSRAPLNLTGDLVEEGLVRLEIDEHGLDRVDRKILHVLLSHDIPVGVKTLAVSVGEAERTIEDVHEPYLIQRGMLLKTPRGRRASSLAQELYGSGTIFQ